MAKPRINPKLLKRVAALTKQGVPQNEIAVQLGVHRNSIYRYQKTLGLSAWPQLSAEEERTIVDLLKAGHGVSWIGRQLRVGEHQARLVAKKYNIRKVYHPRGFAHFHPTAEHLMRITDLALSHQYSAKAIAKMTRVPYRTVVRICHQVLACEKFLGGGTRVGLESYLATKWRSTHRRPLEQPMEISPSYFVWKFFRYSLLPGATLSQEEMDVCASILLEARTKFFGKPADAESYLSELRELVFAQLVATSPSTPVAVN